jgi:hypothetical protein
MNDLWCLRGFPGVYRTTPVNSPGENRPSETRFGSAPIERGAQPSAKNGGISRGQRADRRAERLYAQAMLADGEDSNFRYPIGSNRKAPEASAKEDAVAK